MMPRKILGVTVYWPAWGIAVGGVISIPMAILIYAATGVMPWGSIAFTAGAIALCICGEIWARRRYVTHPPELEMVNECLIAKVVENSRLFEGSDWPPGWAVIERHSGQAKWVPDRASALAIAKAKAAQTTAIAIHVGVN